MKNNLNTTIGNPINILECNGYPPLSELNYCTENGIEYVIGYRENKALVVAIIFDEDIYFITKPELREMSLTAKIKGIDHVTLLTNYGIELHSRLEKPETIGFNRIIKAN